MKVLIAGAGLGGLTAAVALADAGHEVEVYEQAPELGEVGAGIQVSANASRVLIALGLGAALEAVAVRPERIEFRLHDTAELVDTLPLGTAHEARFGAPYWQLYRPEFHAILAARLEALAPGAVRLGRRVEGVAEDGAGVTLKLAGGGRARGDMAIGADGIKSVVRAQLHGAEPANFTGQVAWRGLIPAERLPAGFMDPIFVNWMGPRTHMVVYWVAGGRYLNFVGCVERSDWTEEGWTIRRPWSELKAAYAGFHGDVQTILDAMDRDACYAWALNIRPRLPCWSTARVTLLGDAAHPTIPYMAQGAVMAVEDAAVLTRALAAFGADGPAPALAAYDAARIDRTARIVDESTAHAKLYHHETHAGFRAAFARKDPARDRGRWLYNYDPLTVPLPAPPPRAQT